MSLIASFALAAARDQFDAEGPIEWKRVVAVYKRTGKIFEIVVAGKVIGTTPEHPFYPQAGVWTEANRLRPGDLIRTKTGWAKVEEVHDTGLYEQVYNVQVEDYHTYFVTDDGWEFSVWAHNTTPLCEGTTAINSPSLTETVLVGSRPYTVRYQGVGSNSAFSPNVYRVLSISGQIVLGSPDARSSNGVRRQFQSYLGQSLNAATPPGNYNAGHLIGASLGGPNDTRNLVPQQGPVNQHNGYYQMEDWLRSILGGHVAQATGQNPSAPDKVTMTVTLDYPSVNAPGYNRFIPTKFNVYLNLDGHTLSFTFSQTTSSFTPPSSTGGAPLGYWGGHD